jgi:hypothetical protein
MENNVMMADELFIVLHDMVKFLQDVLVIVALHILQEHIVETEYRIDEQNNVMMVI